MWRSCCERTRPIIVRAVSVVIPARNAAETVVETLESFAAQTHAEWEAIVVDDGSDDVTAEAVEVDVTWILASA